MLTWLVTTALRQRVAVILLAAALGVAGVVRLRSAAFDVFPEFSPPMVEIQTEAPGLSSSQIETLITFPIERVLAGIPWLTALRSKSVLGLSSVVLQFEPRTDLMVARQLVQERLASVRATLPTVSGDPFLLPPLSSLSRVLKVGLSSESLSIQDLSTLAEWTIRPRLIAVPGVSNVALWGARARELQVVVDPDRLQAAGVRLEDVERVTSAAVRPAGGGFLDSPNARIAVSLPADGMGPEALGEIPVQVRNGIAQRLRDVAQVRFGHAPLIGEAVINDGPGILMVVEKQPWANTLEVTRGVEAALEELKPGLEGVAVDSTIFRPATFIELALKNLRFALFVGCALVIVVLVTFLAEWRAALISCLAIPLSLLAAATVLALYGATLNTMVIAGLVIALGEVVDDAIIDVENIDRRLRQSRAAGGPFHAFRVVLEASLEVRSAVVFATFIVVLVFLPIFFLPGVAGAFFRPLAMAYVLAVLASLLVALTVTPALALWLLPRAQERGRGRVVAFLAPNLRRLLMPLLARPGRVAWGIVILLGITASVAPFLGEEFLPSFHEHDFLMHWVGKPGTSLDAMTRSITRVSKELRHIPGVRNFGSHIGRAEAGDEVVGPNFTELWISIDPEARYEETVQRIQAVVAGYPGVYSDVLTYLRERTKEVLTGVAASVVVRIRGNELEALRAKADEVAQALSTIDGVVDLQVEQQTSVPQVEVAYRVEAARLGVGPGELRRAIGTLLRGETVGEVYEEQRVVPVVVRGADRLTRDPTGLLEVRVPTPQGIAIPLRQVADVRIVPAPNAITHEWGARKIDVKCNVRGRALGAFARDVEKRVQGIAFEHGYHPEVLGEFAERTSSRNHILALGGLSLIGIFVLLHVDFRSARLAGLVFASLPFALVGGVAMVLTTGGRVSLGSLVGFVTVLGIAARNGILLISHFRHLETQEGMGFGPDLVLRGTEERLAPILMTALATGLALLPLAIAGNRPGHEIEHPMALVILGGLASSTVLSLLALPALYLRFGRVPPQPTGAEGRS